MGEEQKTEIQVSKTSKTTVTAVIISAVIMLIAAGSMLISTGELKKSVSVSESNYTILHEMSKETSMRISNIEVNQEKRAVVDSAFRADVRKEFDSLKKDNKIFRASIIRLEWKNKLEPIEPSYNNQMKSFHDISNFIYACPK